MLCTYVCWMNQSNHVTPNIQQKEKKIMSRRTSNVKSIKKTLKNQKAKKVLKKTKKNKKEYNFIFLPSKQNQTSQLLTLN